MPELLPSKNYQSQDNIKKEKGSFFKLYNKYNELLVSNEENCSKGSDGWLKVRNTEGREASNLNNFEIQKMPEKNYNEVLDSSFDSDEIFICSSKHISNRMSSKSSVDIFKKKHISENSLFSYESIQSRRKKTKSSSQKKNRLKQLKINKTHKFFVENKKDKNNNNTKNKKTQDLKRKFFKYTKAELPK